MPARKPPEIPLPRSWTGHVRSAMLHVIALAQYAAVYTRSWAASSPNARVRLKADNDRLRQEVALLTEELRIKDARRQRTPPHQHRHFWPTDRMAILELAAARSWSNSQTARVFQLTAATIAAWKKRLTEHGQEALVRMPEPVNKFPDFVRHAVQRLKALCPQLGKVKIAEFLARAGLHLAPSAVGRMVRESLQKPAPAEEPALLEVERRVICDQGAQFACPGFEAWCRRNDIRPRFGAIGQHGSIAVIEQFIRTLKSEGTRRFLVPLLRNSVRRELLLFLGWYNEHRPHMTLRGRTPDEVYFSKPPANRRPRCEPRPLWPRASRCAAPQTLVAGQPGAKFHLELQFVEGRRHLPVVTLHRAA